MLNFAAQRKGNAVRIRDSTCCCEFHITHPTSVRTMSPHTPLGFNLEKARQGIETSQKTYPSIFWT